MKSALGAVALGASAIALGSCGDQRTFGAEEFVAELNERGVAIELGDPLAAQDEETEIHAIEIAAEDEPEKAAAGARAEEDGHAHGGGSLYVLPDDDGALERYRDCEQSASLICFRAANVFLALEDGKPQALARVGAAIADLGETG